jgi:sortase A
MKLSVPHRSLKRILRWTQRVLFAGAVLMFAYCGFILVNAWIFQKEQRRQLDRLLMSRQAERVRSRQPVPAVVPRESPPAATGDLIGRIEISRLGLSVIVIEGTTAAVLRRAAGHIPGTTLPGKPGNIGIAAHRDTFFRPLRNIQQDDIITLTTTLGEYRYRVVSIKIVSPSDVAVLNPSAAEVLTLVTCYPFYFVGSAPNRFIVRAERVGNA